MSQAEGSRQAWQEALAESLGHAPDSGSACPYPCPFCIGAAALKQLNPEVKAHLAAAGKEFLLAAKSFMDALSEESSGGQPGGPGPARVEKIPFD